MENVSINSLYDSLLHIIAMAVETAGVMIIVCGAIFAVWSSIKKFRTEKDGTKAYHTLRANLAYSILLGLEFLIAADIIQTISIDLDMQSVIILAIVVAIRTFLSWSLVVEIEQRWPWQKEAEQP